MSILNIPPVVGWLVLTAIFIGPSVYRLVKRLYRHWRIRRHMKTIPGPLLGVIYPEMKKK